MTNTERIRQEIERRIGAMYNFSSGYSALNTCRELLDFIDSLPKEQPELDLEKEIDNYFKYWTEDECTGAACHYQYVNLNDCRRIACHFYELGLNARKEK